MARRRLRFDLRWLIGLIVAVLLVALLFSPIGKPADSVHMVHLGPKIKKFERVMILPRSPEPAVGSAAGNRGLRRGMSI